MPLHRTSRWFHVVHLCEPTSRGVGILGTVIYEIYFMLHDYMSDSRRTSNISVDCRPLGLEKMTEMISLTGPRLDSLFSQRVSRKSDAHLLLKWDVPNLNSMVVCDVAVNIKLYKSPHPGMNSTGMQPTLLCQQTSSVCCQKHT